VGIFFAQVLPPKGVKNNIFFYPFRLHYFIGMLYYKCKQASLQLTHKKKDNTMLNKDLFALINETAQIESRPAKDIFKSTVALCMHDDELCIQFSTIENRKGYGKQYIPVTDLEQVMAVLLEAKDKGIQSETEKKSTAQIVKESLIENEDGEIRFKSEDTKGKKPTLFTSKDDFDEFVTVMQAYVPKIMAKLQALRNRQ
jgi:hypothetical protein